MPRYDGSAISCGSTPEFAALQANAASETRFRLLEDGCRRNFSAPYVTYGRSRLLDVSGGSGA
jgi:hypothetical protein